MNFSDLLGARSPGDQRQELQNVIILGAGTMGKQISVQCAAHGYNVTLYDVDSDVLRRAKDEVAGIVDWLRSRGLIQPREPDSILKKIRVESDSASASSGADLVIECVFEDLETKRAVFREIGAHSPEHAIYLHDEHLVLYGFYVGGQLHQTRPSCCPSLSFTGLDFKCR